MIKNNILENVNLMDKYFNIKKYFGLSLFFWIIDYFLCKDIQPYHTHWIFHILIGYVSYQVITLLKYIEK